MSAWTPPTLSGSTQRCSTWPTSGRGVLEGCRHIEGGRPVEVEDITEVLQGAALARPGIGVPDDDAYPDGPERSRPRISIQLPMTPQTRTASTGVAFSVHASRAWLSAMLKCQAESGSESRLRRRTPVELLRRARDGTVVFAVKDPPNLADPADAEVGVEDPHDPGLTLLVGNRPVRRRSSRRGAIRARSGWRRPPRSARRNGLVAPPGVAVDAQLLQTLDQVERAADRSLTQLVGVLLRCRTCSTVPCLRSFRSTRRGSPRARAPSFAALRARLSPTIHQVVTRTPLSAGWGRYERGSAGDAMAPG